MSKNKKARAVLAAPKKTTLPADLKNKISELSSDQLEELSIAVHKIRNADYIKKQEELREREAQINLLLAESGILDRLVIEEDISVKVPISIFFDPEQGVVELNIFEGYDIYDVREQLIEAAKKQNKEAIKEFTKKLKDVGKEIAAFAKKHGFELSDVNYSILNLVELPWVQI
jgi:tmRNA-binding protein